MIEVDCGCCIRLMDTNGRAFEVRLKYWEWTSGESLVEEGIHAKSVGEEGLDMFKEEK